MNIITDKQEVKQTEIMNREIKYTTDGRKVLVLANLNSQEKIVQEIFVINNIEVPSGENFVVKALHDAPAISWKEAELKKLHESYEKQKAEYTKMIDALNKDSREKTSLLRNKLEYVGQALKN